MRKYLSILFSLLLLPLSMFANRVEDYIVVPSIPYVAEDVVTVDDLTVSDNVARVDDFTVSENVVAVEDLTVSEDVARVEDYIVVPSIPSVSDDVVTVDDLTVADDVVTVDDFTISENIARVVDYIVVPSIPYVAEDIATVDDFSVAEDVARVVDYIVVPSIPSVYEDVATVEDLTASEDVATIDDFTVSEDVARVEDYIVVPSVPYVSDDVVAVEDFTVPEDVARVEDFTVAEDVVTNTDATNITPTPDATTDDDSYKFFVDGYFAPLARIARKNTFAVGGRASVDFHFVKEFSLGYYIHGEYYLSPLGSRTGRLVGLETELETGLNITFPIFERGNFKFKLGTDVGYYMQYLQYESMISTKTHLSYNGLMLRPTFTIQFTHLWGMPIGLSFYYQVTAIIPYNDYNGFGMYIQL